MTEPGGRAQLTLEGPVDRPPRVVEVFVPGIPPTPNDRPGTWGESLRLRAAWKEAARLAAGRRHDSDPALPRVGELVDVEYCFVYGTRRRRDPDNQVAAAKPLLDGLVAAGLLADDSNATIRRLSTTTEIRRSEIEGVRIRLTEVLE